MFIDRQVPKTTEENKIGRFTPFRSLWLTEDAQWLANRKVEWEAVKENIFSNVSREYHAPAQEIQILARFFLFGEEPEIKTLADSKKRISPQRRIALTPTKTSDELARLFFLLPPDSRDVNYFHSFLSRIYKSYYGFDCLRDRCRLFIDSVCGNTWQLYEELPYLNYKGSRLQETSESASLVAIHLISGARAILIDKVEYHPVIDRLDYCISAIPHLDNARNRKRNNINLEKLFGAIDHGEKNFDEYNPLVQEFLWRLMSNRKKIKEAWTVNAHLDDMT